jgi:hypothetical protein
MVSFINCNVENEFFLLTNTPCEAGNNGLLPISKIVDKVSMQNNGFLWRARPQELGKIIVLVCSTSEQI